MSEKIEIDAEDVEYLRQRLLMIKRSLVIREDTFFNRVYFLGLQHSVPLSLKEQDPHLNDLCQYHWED